MAVSERPIMLHPLIQTEQGVELRQLYKDASTEAEWRFAVARLVDFLVRQSAPPSTVNDPDFKSWVDQIFFEIQNGFQKQKRGRASSIIAAKRDAWAIDLLLDEPTTPKTEAEAARQLAVYSHVTEEAARKRVIRAQKVTGLKLEKAKPFGHGKKFDKPESPSEV